MKAEDAIYDAVNRMAAIIAEKLRSCAKDDKFLDGGEQIVARLVAKGKAKGSPVRIAMVTVLTQAALFAEEGARLSQITIVTKDKDPT